MSVPGAGEEFPNFTRFYFQPSDTNSHEVILYAALEGPSLTGAYKFVMRRDKAVTTETDGYQAPPLDGVWATAPYFHNGSAPTLDDVLNSTSRPPLYTRNFHTDEGSFDRERVGWKVERLKARPTANLPAIEERKIYDTSLPGRSNAGHTFGDRLAPDERRALIEYLKTL